MTFSEILAIYEGSNGDATRALYARLAAIGPSGDVAINLFRAHKSSSRAKVYRGGGYRGMAYDRKQWSMDNLCRILGQRCTELGITWGWKRDPQREAHVWVLYVDLPNIGQVSFHTGHRGDGPDYPGEWDGVREVGSTRICRLVESVLKVEHREALSA